MNASTFFIINIMSQIKQYQLSEARSVRFSR
jgi:hypothetical protein